MSLIIRTKEDIAAEAEKKKRASAAEAARRYLAETDWMIVRSTETGKPVPPDVIEARAAARLIAGKAS